MRIPLVAPAVLLVAATACLPSFGVVPSTGQSPESGTPTARDCDAASPVVIDLLGGALTIRGSYLSNLIGAPADERDAAVLPAGVVDPWWIAGKINGIGVRPEVGVWLWDGAGSGSKADLWSANASASRYFTLAEVDPSVAASSAVATHLLDCVGPIPAP